MSSLSKHLWQIINTKPHYASFVALRETHKNILKETGSQLPIIVDQAETINQRSTVPRKENRVPKANYLQFLKYLYPDSQHVHFKSLYRAYKRLPEPQPLFINHHHLEHMMDQLIKSSASDADISDFFSNVLTDLRKSKLRVSWKEENASTFTLLGNYKNEGHLYVNYFTTVKNRFKKCGFVDVSTINIFLKLAIVNDNSGLLNRINKDFARYKIKPNRISFELLIIYAISKNELDSILDTLKAMVKHGFIIDITIINNCLKALINNDEIAMVHKIIKQLETNLNKRSNNINLKSKHAKRIYINSINLLDSLNLQTDNTLLFPVAPVFETYDPLINHYLELKHFHSDNLLELLKNLVKHEINIPNSVFLKIFDVLKSHHLQKSNYEEFLKIYKTQIPNHVKYDSHMFDSVLASNLKQNSAKLPKDIRDQSLVLQSNYRRIESKNYMRPWQLVNINHMLSEYIDDVVVS